MKADGTKYLVKVEFQNGFRDWEIVSFMEPVGLSCDTLGKKWCNQTGFALKFKRFIEVYELNCVISKIRNC